MVKVFEILKGTRVIEEVYSPVNGKIEVIKSLAFGTYIQVGGLTQSGGVVSDVWKTSLKKVLQSKKVVKNCLVLGFGAGSNALLVRKNWPDAKITGIDLDKHMVKLGREYLNIKKDVADVEIRDAYDFVRQAAENKIKYDLVLIDLYIGHEYPKVFERIEFIKLTKKVLNKNGIVVFNRLYYEDKRKLAVKFSKLLESVYGNIKVVYPEANVMYICNN